MNSFDKCIFSSEKIPAGIASLTLTFQKISAPISGAAYNIVINNITQYPGYVTVSIPNMGFQNGDQVTITGVSAMTDLNGTWTISSVTSTTFNVLLTTTQLYAGGGQVQLGDGTTNTISLAGTNTFITLFGQVRWEYDTSNLLLIPGISQLELVDGDGILYNYFWNNNIWQKKPILELDIDRGAGSGAEVIANVDPTNSTFRKNIKTLTLTSIPSTDVLNNAMVYQVMYISPFPKVNLDYLVKMFTTSSNYVEGINTINPLGYQQGSMHKITDVIKDIYKIINPDINLTIYQDWIFKGQWVSYTRNSNGNINGRQLNYQNCSFEDLYILTDDLFFNSSFGFKSLGDVLKQLAFEFGCYTGMTDNNNAFFKSIFSSNAPVIALQPGQVEALEPAFSDIPKTFVKVNVRQDASNLPYYSAGLFTGQDNSYIEKNILSYYNLGVWDNGETNNPSGGYYDINGSRLGNDVRNVLSNIFFTGQGNPNNAAKYYTPYSIDDGTINQPRYYIVDALTSVFSENPLTQNNMPQQMAGYWFTFKSSLQNTMLFTFTLTGTNYSFVDNYSYLGEIYQPVGMTKDYDIDQTTMDCILISSLIPIPTVLEDDLNEVLTDDQGTVETSDQ
jgi:hypothetical protein